MENKNLKVRIIGKTKEGAILKSGSNKVAVPWEEFNKYWMITEDKFHAIAKDELVELLKKADDLVSWAVIAMRRNMVIRSKPEDQRTPEERNEFLTNVLTIGKNTKKIDEILGPGEGIKRITELYRQMFTPAKDLINRVAKELLPKKRKVRREDVEKMVAEEKKKKQDALEEKAAWQDNIKTSGALGDFMSEETKKKLGL